MMTPLLVLLAVAVSLAQPEPEPQQTKDFTLRGEILLALEGGPVVVKVSLVYHGKEELEVYPVGQRGYSARVEPDKRWKSRPLRERIRTGVFSGIISSSDTIRPGERWEEICYLHYDYTNIIAGKATLHIDDHIYKPGKRSTNPDRLFEVGNLLAHPSTVLTFDIPRATPERVREMARRFEAKLAKPALSDKERDHLAECVLRTSHAEFIPTAFYLVKSGGSDSSDLLQFIYDRSATPAAAHTLLVDYLLEDNPAEARSILNFWRFTQWQASMSYLFERLPQPREIPKRFVNYFLYPFLLEMDLEYCLDHLRAKRLLLPDDQLRRLCGAKNVWVRLLTYVTFRDRCDSAWVADLMADLKRLSRPLPAEEFDRLLEQLDSRSFRTREEATAALLHHGDAVAPALRAALKKPLTLEVKARVRRILAEFERQPIDALGRRTLSHLEWLASSDNKTRAPLEALARGAPGARLTEAAKAALARIDKKAERR